MVLVAIGLGLASCAASSNSTASLATGRVAADFTSYSLHRIGVLPFESGGGDGLDPESSRSLQEAFVAALARRSSAEIVPLSISDLEAIHSDDPFRTGRVDPRAVLTLAHRANLDAICVGRVTDQRGYAPQRLGLAVELVACDTGLSIWSASVHLDASEERVRGVLEAWCKVERGSENATGGANEGPEVYLLSPRRFGEFAAAQVARLF
jgi:hypothetical protein